ncbi:MAG: hypothetical protein H6825_06920 [Planctomycetes bacterium]|nr:hypothetical protein [Planctomycetota bacterium]
MPFLVPLAISLVLALVAPATPAQAASPAVDAGTLVVLLKSSHEAALVDASSLETVATLPTGRGPHEAAISPDGRLAVVADYGDQTPGHTLTVLDLERARVTRTIDLGELSRPHGLAFLPDGKRLLVTSEVAGRLAIVELSSGRVLAGVPTEGQVSHMVALDADGARAYVANIGSGSVSVIDTSDATLVRVVPTGAGCEGIAVRPGGREVWTANRAADTLSVLDTETLEVVAELPCAGFPIRVAFTPDGRRALVTSAQADALTVFDATTREPLERLVLQADLADDAGSRLFGEAFAGSAAPVGVLVTPDGRRAFVACTNADRVFVLDLERLVFTGAIALGPQPDGMGFSPRRTTPPGSAER